MSIVAGDIGGTRARFAVHEAGSKPVYKDVLESRSFPTFEAAFAKFLDGARAKLGTKLRIEAATFGIAGPVIDQRCRTTNLPWTVDARVVAKRFGIGKATLLNDLVAVGHGALAAPSSKLTVLQVGRPKKKGGNLAVIAAGTGLGEAVFVWDGANHVACPTEGSHVEFAPRTPVEAELLARLTSEHGHVSYERVASGSTIVMLYRFFVERMRVKESKDAAAMVARAEDPNVAVVELARKGKSDAAVQAIELWCSVYGAEAGNLALKCLSSAGVFVCGGVSANLADVLSKGLPKRPKPAAGSPFLEAFVDKGRMRPLLEAMPVAVCLEPQAGIMGALAHARSVI